MKVKLYSVYDSKVKNFSRPLYHRNAAEAIRAFEMETNNPESQLNKYPEDFTLFEVGEFDDETAMYSQGTHTSLGKAIYFIQKENIAPKLQEVTQ